MRQEEAGNMKAAVDKETCIGCSLCASICSDVFEMDDANKAQSIVDEVPSQAEACAREAADTCPVNAITVA
jgi:ferredoxin